MLFVLVQQDCSGSNPLWELYNNQSNNAQNSPLVFFSLWYGRPAGSLPLEQVLVHIFSRSNQEVYEWISECVGFTSFYGDRAQSHETSQTQSPLKLHRAGLNPSKYTQYWNPGVWRTFILGRLSIDWIERSTLQFISFLFELMKVFPELQPNTHPQPPNNNRNSCQLLQLYSELHLSSDPQNLRPVN